MAFKFFFFAAVLAVANAATIARPAYNPYTDPLAYAAPVAKYVSPVEYSKVVSNDAKYDHNPQYHFAYDVQDALTGDTKSQHESRNGDVVEGSYSLVDADGYRRTVDYTADPVTGFNAAVHREPLGQAIKAVAPVAKIVEAAEKVAEPVEKATPVSKYTSPFAYSAPGSKYTSPLAYRASPFAYRASPFAYGTAPGDRYTSPYGYRGSPFAYGAAPAYYN